MRSGRLWWKKGWEATNNRAGAGAAVRPCSGARSLQGTYSNCKGDRWVRGTNPVAAGDVSLAGVDPPSPVLLEAVTCAFNGQPPDVS